MKKIFWFFLCCFLSLKLFAQSGPVKSFVLLSGVVVDQNSLDPIPFAKIRINNTSEVICDSYGLFSFPTFTGDTLTFYVSHKPPLKLIVPRREDAAFSIIVQLSDNDTSQFVTEVFPYVSLKTFEKAFLMMELPKSDAQIEADVQRKIFDRMYGYKPADGQFSYRKILNQPNWGITQRSSKASYTIVSNEVWEEVLRMAKQKYQKDNKQDLSISEKED